MLILSNHATSMLEERRIEREWMERVLRFPDWETPDPTDSKVIRAFGSIAEAGGKILRVVYKDADDDRLVVTVFFDRDAEHPFGQKP